MIFTIEVTNQKESAGEGIRITFDNGNSVMIYPHVKREEKDQMIVNICSPEVLEASVEVSTEIVNVFNLRNR